MDDLQKCKIGLHGVSTIVAGRNLFVVQRLLMDPISIPWVKDERIWSNGGMIIDGGMAK